MKNRSFVVAASFVLALVLASAKDARAVEHQHHLGLDGGLSMLKIDDKDSLSVGGGVGAHYAYGLTDQFNLMVEGATNVVALGEFVGPGFSTKHPSGVDSLGVGLGYVLDITRVESRAITRPAPMPIALIRSPCPITSRKMLALSAPNAMRMPISEVRCRTTLDRTP